MVQFIEILPDFAVSPQVDAQALADAAAAGFRSIINNRPDHEVPGQPHSTDLASVAMELSLEYRHIPVVSSGISEDQIAAFAAALAELPGPVLAFCRSGTRSTMIWALSQAESHHPEVLLAHARAAGYDLSGLAPALAERARRAAGGAAAPQDGRPSGKE